MPQKTKKKNTKKVTKKDDSKKVDIDEELTVSEEFEEESSRVKLFFMELKNNPKKAFTTLGAFIKRVFYNNKLFFLFLLLNVVNAFLLRLFTINVNNSAFRLDTLLADFSFILIIGSFSFFMKKRKYVVVFIAILIWLSSITILSFLSKDLSLLINPLLMLIFALKPLFLFFIPQSYK